MGCSPPPRTGGRRENVYNPLLRTRKVSGAVRRDGRTLHGSRKSPCSQSSTVPQVPRYSVSKTVTKAKEAEGKVIARIIHWWKEGHPCYIVGHRWRPDFLSGYGERCVVCMKRKEVAR